MSKIYAENVIHRCLKKIPCPSAPFEKQQKLIPEACFSLKYSILEGIFGWNIIPLLFSIADHPVHVCKTKHFEMYVAAYFHVLHADSCQLAEKITSFAMVIFFEVWAGKTVYNVLRLQLISAFIMKMDPFLIYLWDLRILICPSSMFHI